MNCPRCVRVEALLRMWEEQGKGLGVHGEQLEAALYGEETEVIRLRRQLREERETSELKGRLLEQVRAACVEAEFEGETVVSISYVRKALSGS